MCLGHKKLLRKTRIKLYNTPAFPVLLYGSETWTIKARDAKRMTATEMKYMRRPAGYASTDYKTNTQIGKEFKKNTNFRQITGIQEKLDNVVLPCNGACCIKKEKREGEREKERETGYNM